MPLISGVIDKIRILPIFLYSVQAPVRLFIEGIIIRIGSVVDGAPDTDGDMYAFFFIKHDTVHFLNDLIQPCLYSVMIHHSDGVYHEFVPAHTHDDVRFLERVSQHAGYLLQHFVAHLVSVPVIDGFKIIHIDDEKGAGILLPYIAADQEGAAAPVVNACQRIALGPFQSFFDIAGTDHSPSYDRDRKNQRHDDHHRKMDGILPEDLRYGMRSVKTDQDEGTQENKNAQLPWLIQDQKWDRNDKQKNGKNMSVRKYDRFNEGEQGYDQQAGNSVDRAGFLSMTS